MCCKRARSASVRAGCLCLASSTCATCIPKVNVIVSVLTAVRRRMRGVFKGKNPPFKRNYDVRHPENFCHA